MSQKGKRLSLKEKVDIVKHSEKEKLSVRELATKFNVKKTQIMPRSKSGVKRPPIDPHALKKVVEAEFPEALILQFLERNVSRDERTTYVDVELGHYIGDLNLFNPETVKENGTNVQKGDRNEKVLDIGYLRHVLGQCPKGELLINARHHRVRHALATSLKTLNWEIHEEVHCVSPDGSLRQADIIAINGRLKRALVLDPTIRFERNLNQATEVDIEKKSIYEPCMLYLSQKYNVPLKQWSVIGLLFGSRGSITKFTWNYLKELHIPFDYVMSVLLNIIKDSLQILHHHFYFN
ncbi:hypothetical protein ANN_09187 [Periplaneta americana]|uniref:HTH psq-type domain-containing protein n=1 Tax=Periplaneta americana TaxID=6978 RepID=A0ABQ8TM45_PERAM|nr:hypothetical protein ANN_09187 [Periplaneta americana]